MTGTVVRFIKIRKFPEKYGKIRIFFVVNVKKG